MAVSSSLRETPLHDKHLELGAHMTSFGGFNMPVRYEGIIAEHMAVREAAGLFDVSHMGEFIASGPDAAEAVNRIVTNDVSSLYDGKALYTVMCKEDGGILDDLIVYRLAEDRYLLVVNAANIEKDWNWVEHHTSGDVSWSNVSDEIALLALQGPKSHEIMQEVLRKDGIKLDIGKLQNYHFQTVEPLAYLGEHGLISYTGYTGEKGLEIYCSNKRAGNLWDRITDVGADMGLVPAGLGARDTLRMEAGYCLYGQDLSEEVNPYEARLGWVVKPDKVEFIGRDALLKSKEAGAQRSLVSFVMQERGIPREGYDIYDHSSDKIGTVTSGTQSPVLKKGIGMGFVQNRSIYREPGAAFDIVIREKPMPAVVKKPPLHTN